MTPRRLAHTYEITTSFKLGPSLKFIDVEVSLGEIARDQTGQRQEVLLQGEN